MTANLNGVIFDQIYGDNSGGAEFDTDGDGTKTQEDEFVSVRNTTDAPVDISGWQIWSSSSGTGAPDSPRDGLYHTFPPGTVLAPDETLYVINEITGSPPGWAQEASQGGTETGGGGTSSNLLTEGMGSGGSSHGEAVVLLDPTTGRYIVFSMADSFSPSDIPGFPGTTNVGQVDGQSVQADQNAGSSYQYDDVDDGYTYAAVFVPCFAAGTLVATPEGARAVESLAPGDLVLTLDHGPRPVGLVLSRDLDFVAGDDPCQKPVEFRPGSLGPGLPRRRLVVSPQHRMLVARGGGEEALVPAKALIGRRGVRAKTGCRRVSYVQLVFDRHELVLSEGVATETFYPGAYAVSACDAATRAELLALFPGLAAGRPVPPARRLLRVGEARRTAGRAHRAPSALRPAPGTP